MQKTITSGVERTEEWKKDVQGRIVPDSRLNKEGQRSDSARQNKAS